MDRNELRQHMSGGTTHAEGCHTWGHRHYDCALAEIERLRVEVERYRFLISKGKVPIRCSSGYYYEDGVMHATPEAAIDAARGAEVEG